MKEISRKRSNPTEDDSNHAPEAMKLYEHGDTEESSALNERFDNHALATQLETLDIGNGSSVNEDSPPSLPGAPSNFQFNQPIMVQSYILPQPSPQIFPCDPQMPCAHPQRRPRSRTASDCQSPVTNCVGAAWWVHRTPLHFPNVTRSPSFGNYRMVVQAPLGSTDPEIRSSAQFYPSQARQLYHQGTLLTPPPTSATMYQSLPPASPALPGYSPAIPIQNFILPLQPQAGTGWVPGPHLPYVGMDLMTSTGQYQCPLTVPSVVCAGVSNQTKPLQFSRDKESSNKKRQRKPKSLTNVYIKNLPSTFTEADLSSLAPDPAKLRSMKLVNEEKSNCYGFIDFSSHEAAEAALLHIEACHPNFSAAFAFETPKDPTNLYITNLPLNWTDASLDTLKSTFKNFGEITNAAIMTNLTDKHCTGAGFVRFTNPDSAQAAIEYFRKNRCSLDGGSGPLEVKLADFNPNVRYKTKSISSGRSAQETLDLIHNSELQSTNPLLDSPLTMSSSYRFPGVPYRFPYIPTMPASAFPQAPQFDYVRALPQWYAPEW